MSQPLPAQHPAAQPKPLVSPLSSDSFLARLGGGVVLLNLFVFVLVGLSMQQGHHQYQERAEIAAKNLTQILESEIAGAIEIDDMALFAVMDEYKKQRAGGGVDGKVLNTYIEQMRSRLPEIDALRITDAQGVLIYGNDVMPGARTSVADRPHFARLRDDPRAGLVISKPQVSRVNQKRVIVLARRIEQPDGSFGGMAFAAITLDHLSKTFSTLNVGPRGVLVLRDEEFGVVVRYPEAQGVGSAIGTRAVAREFQEMIGAGQAAGTTTVRSSVDAVERAYSYRRIGAYPLYVIVGLATDDFLADWRDEAAKQAALVALFVLMTLAAAWLIYRIWKRQVNLVAALARQEAKFHTLADFTFDWEYWKGPQEEILYMTPSCERVTGYTRAEFAADPALLLRIIHPDDRRVMDRHLHAIARQNASPDGAPVDFRILRRDGEIRWIAHHCRVISGRDGEAMGRRVSNRDVTENKRLEQEREQYWRFFQLSIDPMCIADPYGCFKQVNPAFVRLTGFAESELVAKPFLEFILPEDRQRTAEEMKLQVSARPSLQFENRYLRKDGTVIRLLWTAYFDKSNGVTYATARDVTALKQAEQQLRIAATAFEAQEGMMITDAGNVILRVNRAFTDITGYPAEEAVGRTPSLLKSGRHDDVFYAAIWEGLRQQGVWQGEIWNRRKNGEVYPEWLTITAVRGDAGEVTHYVGTLTDITLRKAAEDEIKHLAFYDPLTRLPNRRLLLDRLRQALASSTRSRREGALLFIDLDNFKTLNDTLGHDVGDLLLQQVAQRLTTCIREGDSVARLGGDEFVVMLEDLSENPREAATQTETVGEKIIATLNQPYLLAGHTHHSTPSIGATLFNDHLNSVDELLKRADLAMYQAKAAGRNTLRFFDPEMQAAVTTRAALEADLRQGLQQNGFLLYYQAQVDEDGRMTGAEALLRWQHPRRGLMLPADFIPLAEETGLILPLGHWVLETACARLVAWATRPEMAHLTLAVNVSARQFHHPDFVDQVLVVLDRTGADPQKLKLELTESLLLEDVEDIIAKMTALKERGVGFSLDDFGTGYSSLSYLKRLPLDQLKIDQSFVRDILTDSNDAAIARTIVALAQSMGLGVIAEGVETEEQRDFLARQSCHAFQGYLFGRPLPAAEFGPLPQRD